MNCNLQVVLTDWGVEKLYKIWSPKKKIKYQYYIGVKDIFQNFDLSRHCHHHFVYKAFQVIKINVRHTNSGGHLENEIPRDYFIAHLYEAK